MTSTFEISRRNLLIAGGAAASLSTFAITPVWAAISSKRITLLYRPESERAPSRLDPVVQSALLALEDEYQRGGYQVIQPDAATYAVMDRGPGVVVTFKPDAGLTLLVSAYFDLRPTPGQNGGIAEVRLQSRTYIGRVILSSDEGRGQVFTRTDADVAEFGRRRGLEVASRKAAADLVARFQKRVGTLSDAELERMATQSFTPVVASAVEVQPPNPAVTPAPVPTPQVQAPAPAPSKPPAGNTATTAPAAPAPASVATPAPTAPVAVAAPSKIGKRFGLVVGVSDYGPVRARNGLRPEQLSSLGGVAKDVQNVYDTLNGLGFQQDHVIQLFNEKATSQNIRYVLKSFAKFAGKDDLVFIFISAHGAAKDGAVSGYGMPVLADFTTRGGVEQANLLDFWELQGMCRNLPTDNVVWVIDTCFSGNAARNLTTVQIGGNGVQAGQGVGTSAATVAGQNGWNNFLVLTASAENETSLDTSQGGLFAYNFLSAVQSTRGKVPLTQLVSEKVIPTVVRSSRDRCRAQGNKCDQPQQTPQIAYSGHGNAIRLA